MLGIVDVVIPAIRLNAVSAQNTICVEVQRHSRKLRQPRSSGRADSGLPVHQAPNRDAGRAQAGYRSPETGDAVDWQRNRWIGQRDNGHSCSAGQLDQGRRQAAMTSGHLRAISLSTDAMPYPRRRSGAEDRGPWTTTSNSRNLSGCRPRPLRARYASSAPW